jgi:hypothetical protein
LTLALSGEQTQANGIVWLRLNMKYLYKTKIAKWFFKKYFGIDKEVFKVTKTEIHYWSDKEKGEAQCRVYQFNIFDIPVLQNLKRLALLPLLFVKMPFVFFVGLTTDVTATNNGDTELYSNLPNTASGSNTTMHVYQDTGETDHGLIKFTLPSGSGTISSIKLFMYLHYSYANNTINCHSVTQTGWTEAGATWNKYDGSTNWTTPGGDYNATVICHYVNAYGTAATVNAYVPFVLQGTGSDNPLSKTWGDTVNLLLKDSTDSGSNRGVQFYQKDNGSNMPYIEITYTVATNTGGFFSFF